MASTQAFVHDLCASVVNALEISSDGFPAYRQAIDDAFDIDCTYGQIVKKYVGEPFRQTPLSIKPPIEFVQFFRVKIT